MICLVNSAIWPVSQTAELEKGDRLRVVQQALLMKTGVFLTWVWLNCPTANPHAGFEAI